MPTNQKTTIAAIVLATILAASIIVMALPFESAEAGRGGDADIRQDELYISILFTITPS